ncbi:MAG TPA: hypothetical protein VLG49_00585 [Rhabdochlamydiaceae bacterium]|nr:hypothetical protein [Rhabdochlamydiaceae bacterium]
MKKILIPLSVFTIIGILFSGCASYSAASLNSLSSELMLSPTYGTNNNVFVTAKAFTKADCKKYLDRDVLKKGYQPIQLYIQNNSDKSYSFSLDRISLSCARPEEVSEKVHTSTVGRAAGYGAASLILWPLAIPAVIDGVKSSQANEALDNDFSSKAARDQIIFPHSHFNKLLFVPVNEYQSSFTVTLIDQESHETTILNIVTN